MACIKVTINNTGSGPFQIRNLFGASSSLASGVSVSPAFTAVSNGPKIPAMLTVQNDSSTANTVYWGDPKMSGTTGIAIASGTSFSKSYVPTDGEYINSASNGAIIIIDSYGGTP